MNVSTVQLFLFDWIKAQTSWTTIKEKSSEPRPALPYASFDFVNPSNRVGSMDELKPTGNKTNVQGMRRTLVSIHTHGAGAIDKMSNLRDSLDSPDVVALFSAAGLAHENESEVRDLSERLENSYEERGQMDLTLTYAFNKEVDVSTIEHANLTGTIGDHDEEEIIVNPV